MAATTVDRDDQRQEYQMKAHAVKAATLIPKGVLVATDATGYLINFADAATSRFMGVSAERKDNSAGVSGALLCRCEKVGEYEFVYNGGDATQALVGVPCYGVDNQTVDEDVAITTGDVLVGIISEVISATKVRVAIRNYAR